MRALSVVLPKPAEPMPDVQTKALVCRPLLTKVDLKATHS